MADESSGVPPVPPGGGWSRGDRVRSASDRDRLGEIVNVGDHVEEGMFVIVRWDDGGEERLPEDAVVPLGGREGAA